MPGYVASLRSAVGHAPLILAGACVVVMDREGRILLQLRRDNAAWGLPGGLLEPGGSLEEAARREVFEETGLAVSALRLYGVYSGRDLFYQYPNGDQVHHVTAAYIAEDFSGRLQADGEEGRALRFFPLDALPLEISPPLIPIIRDIVQDSRGRATHRSTMSEPDQRMTDSMRGRLRPT